MSCRHALAEQMQAIGWRVLAEVPGREIVFGAVTKPWEADPEFRGIPASDFLAFHEPGYVKIAWTLRADAISGDESMFRTETRVRTTDAAARSKFRRYWAFASPGVALHSSSHARAGQVRSRAACGGGTTEEARRERRAMV